MNLEERLKLMAEFEGDLNLYISNLNEFYASAIEMLDNHILMG